MARNTATTADSGSSGSLLDWLIPTASANDTVPPSLPSGDTTPYMPSYLSVGGGDSGVGPVDMLQPLPDTVANVNADPYQAYRAMQSSLNDAIRWADKNLAGQERNQYIGALLNNYSAGISAAAATASQTDAQSLRGMLRDLAKSAQDVGYDPMQFQGRSQPWLSDSDFSALRNIYHNTLPWASGKPDMAAAAELLRKAGVSFTSNPGDSETKKAMQGYIGDRYSALYIFAGALSEVPPVMLKAQGMQESQFDYLARSATGALGIAQFLAGTASDLKLKDRTDPVASIYAQAKYMRSLYDRFGEAATEADRWQFALAAYNQGQGNGRLSQPGRWSSVNGAISNYATTNSLGTDPTAWRGRVTWGNIAASRYINREQQNYVNSIYPTNPGGTDYYRQYMTQFWTLP